MSSGPRRASHSSSPLAQPKAVIYQLASEIQEWLYLPDPSPLYIVLGTMAANMIKGPAVWTMLVGPSGCGKTELLMATLGIPGTFDASHISGPAALLSGSSKKDIRKDKEYTGGLLREIGDYGALVIDDFTSTIMAMMPAPRQEVLAALRTLFYGHWSRTLGTDGGRRLEWNGKLTLLSGGTPVIERFHGEISDFGERWVYYRYKPNEGWGESRSALTNKDPMTARASLRASIRAFMDILELTWGAELERREWSAAEYTRLIALAGLTAKMRSGTVRDYQRKEIIAIPQPEAPQRLAVTLGQLWMGLERIGLDNAECWRLVERISWDSAPMLSSAIVRMLWNSAKGQREIDEIRRQTNCGQQTIVRMLEDLEAHHLITREKKLVKLTPTAIEELYKASGH